MIRHTVLGVMIFSLFLAACAQPEEAAVTSGADIAVEVVSDESPQQESAVETAPQPAEEAASTEEQPQVEDATVAETTTEETQDIELVPSEDIDWLAVSNRIDLELSVLGNPDAPLTIVEYSDFMWPGCRAHVVGTEPELNEAYVKSGQVKMVFHPVLNHGDRSYQTHQAVECAGDQDQFWPFRIFMFEQQSRLWRGDVRETVKALAQEFGLDTTDFNACIDEQRYYDRIQVQDDVRRERGIRAQPMFDIGGDIYAGSAPFATFAEIIDKKINSQ